MTTASVSAASARAQALLAMGRPGQALSLLGAALAQAPDSTPLLCLTARAQLALGEPGQALESAKAAIRTAPDDEWGYRLASIAASRQRQAAVADDFARQAVELAPQSWRPYFQLARVQADSEFPHLAIKTAGKAIELAPTEADAHFVLGYAASRCGNTALAESAYRRALALNPNHSSAANNLAVLSMRSGRMLPAARGLGAALRSDANLQVAQDNLTAVAYRYLARFHRVAWLVLMALWFVGRSTAASTTSLTDHSEADVLRPAVSIIAAVALAGLTAAAVLIDRRLPSNIRAFYRRMPFREPLLGLWISLDCAALLVVIILPQIRALPLSLCLGTAWTLLLIAVLTLRRHVSVVKRRQVIDAHE